MYINYVKLFANLCIFSTIVPSYVIYIKSPHKFLSAARSLRETEVGHDFTKTCCHRHCHTKTWLRSAKSHNLLHWLPFITCNPG